MLQYFHLLQAALEDLSYSTVMQEILVTFSYQGAQVNLPNTVCQIQEQHSWAKCGKGVAPYPSFVMAQTGVYLS